MFACPRCFVIQARLVLEDSDRVTGTCDLCNAPSDVWPAGCWAEALEPVLCLYVEDPTARTQLAEHLASAWDIFTDPHSHGVPPFVDALCSTAGADLAASSNVSLRDGKNDAEKLWAEFSSAVRYTRRWFFDRSEIDDALEQAARGRPTFALAKGMELYRGRICDRPGVGFPWEKMGAPEPHLARPGRANTAGIPVLYAATTEELAIYECRPARKATVAVSRVRAEKDLQLADLTPGSNRRPNPFALDPDDLGRSLRDSALGALVSGELSRPVHDTDNQLDYIPTQYVAERLADLGYDGIRYQSSFAKPGENVVVFDPRNIHVLHKAPGLFDVSSVNLGYAESKPTRPRKSAQTPRPMRAAAGGSPDALILHGPEDESGSAESTR